MPATVAAHRSIAAAVSPCSFGPLAKTLIIESTSRSVSTREKNAPNRLGKGDVMNNLQGL
jgi:hypothetical protein